MADNTVTTAESHQTAKGNAQTAPTPATVKPHAPSPAALAQNTHAPVRAHATNEQQALEQAQSFGRVDDNGTVFVRQDGSEREVGQFPNATAQEALNLYARRYLELKSKLDLFATRLKASNIKPREIEETLTVLGNEVAHPDVVGDIDALQQQFAKLKQAGELKREQIAAARKAAMEKAIAERTQIVEEAEQIAASLGDNTNWRNTAAKFRSLFDQWQQHQRTAARIDKTEADVLWKRFSTARTKFNQERRKWSQNREAEHTQARAAKEAIIAEANEIKDSTNWAETSRQFNDLMARWKRSGRAGRSEDDELWAQFRLACDTFYNARQAARDEENAQECENLSKKEALLAQAQALLPVNNAQEAKQARQKLAAIQEEWDQIGYVPRDDKGRIESGLDAVDRQIKAVEDAAWKRSDPEADARKSSFEGQLQEQLAQITEQIAAEKDPKKKAKLEAEKATKEQWLNAIK